MSLLIGDETEKIGLLCCFRLTIGKKMVKFNVFVFCLYWLSNCVLRFTHILITPCHVICYNALCLFYTTLFFCQEAVKSWGCALVNCRFAAHTNRSSHKLDVSVEVRNTRFGSSYSVDDFYRGVPSPSVKLLRASYSITSW